MGKYIDAERLESDGWTMSRTRPLSHTEMLYETRKPTDFPEAEVVEIKHGRWILDENPHDGDCRCSVCRVAIDAMNERNHEMLNILTGGKWWTFYHYCPWCGAKMEENK